MRPLSRAWSRLALTIFVCGMSCLSVYDESPAGTPLRVPVRVEGEQIARQICSACHVVAIDQEFPPRLGTPTPSFIEIANRPETTAKGLQAFLKATHWDNKTIPISMPNPMLIPEQRAAVARYVMSLRAP
jgi:mono/diheme cytochrome c family protein